MRRGVPPAGAATLLRRATVALARDGLPLSASGAAVADASAPTPPGRRGEVVRAARRQASGRPDQHRGPRAPRATPRAASGGVDAAPPDAPSCRATCVDRSGRSVSRGVTCPASETCVDGSCIAGCFAVPCAGVVCSAGLFCDPGTGKCAPIAPCQMDCGAGKACHLACASLDPCAGRRARRDRAAAAGGARPIRAGASAAPQAACAWTASASTPAPAARAAAPRGAAFSTAASVSRRARRMGAAPVSPTAATATARARTARASTRTPAARRRARPT